MTMSHFGTAIFEFMEIIGILIAGNIKKLAEN